MGTDLNNQPNIAARPGVPSPKAVAANNQASANDPSQGASANASPDQTAGVDATSQHHNQVIGFVDGFFKEGVDTVKGLVTVVTHPIKTLKGLTYMVTHPVQAAQAIVEPYTSAWKDGRYGEAIGRGSFEALTILLTSGAASGLGKGGQAAVGSAKAADAAQAVAKTGTGAAVATHVAADAGHGVGAVALTEEAAAKAAARAANNMTLSLAHKLAKEGALQGSAAAAVKDLKAAGVGEKMVEALKANPGLLQRVAGAKHLTELSVTDQAALDAIERSAVHGAAAQAGQATVATAGAAATHAAPAAVSAEVSAGAKVQEMALKMTPGQKLDAALAKADASASAVKGILNKPISIASIADSSAQAVGDLVDGTGRVIGKVYDAGGRLVTDAADAVTNAAGHVVDATNRGLHYVATSVADAGQAIADGATEVVTHKFTLGQMLASPVTIPLGVIKLAANHPLVTAGAVAGGQLNIAGQAALAGSIPGDSNNGDDPRATKGPNDVGAPTANQPAANQPDTSPAAEGKFRIYKLHPDDTLEAIAQRELGDKARWQEIYLANKALFDGVAQGTPLAPNTEIKIPVDAPSANKPATNKPATSKPVAHKPVTSAPAANKPATNKPSAPHAPEEVAPVTTVKGPDGRLYTVVKGDTLTGIADNQLEDWRRWHEIQKLNAERYPSLATNPDFLAIGWQLNLPGVKASEPAAK